MAGNVIGMDWNGAQVRLEKIDEDLCRSLGRLYHCVPEEYRANLLFAEKKYNFSSVIIQDGVPISPDGCSFDDEFIFPSGLPLGIITKNYCDVIEYKPVSNDTKYNLSYQSKAILGIGDFLGVFEFMDYVHSVNINSLPDWTILSGCNNFFFSGEIPKGKFNAINSANSINLTFGQFNDSLFIGERINKILSHIKAPIPAVEILFFSKAWYNLIFEELPKDIISDDTDSCDLEMAQLKIRHALLSRSWRAASISRDIHSNLRQYFKSSDGDANENGYNLMTSILDIVYLRRAIYRPARPNTTMIPYEEIIKSVLEPAQLAPIVMVPKYYKEDRDNYVPLSMLMPSIASGGSTTQTRLHAAIVAIRSARREAEKKDGWKKGNIIKIFDTCVDILRLARFYIPREEKARFFYYKLTGAIDADLIKIDQKSLRLHVDGDRYVEEADIFENSSFFRACMKIPAISR
jgi:hypothetical protein